MSYEFSEGSTFYTNSKGERIKVANFNANILTERQLIDGKAVQRTYVIAGKHEKGHMLPQVEIPADQFPSMAWVGNEWGSTAVMYPVTNAKEALRTAIQVNSEPIVEQVFTATGWHEIDKKTAFLKNGGAMFADGLNPEIDIDLPLDLKGYKFASKPSKVKDAMHAATQLPDLIGSEIGYLILACVFRAPLGADFAVHITGRTGTYKSEIAACAQSFFGEFNARELPASWSSTANAIEALAYRAKDCLMVVDDFIPTGTSYQQRAYQVTADRLIRAAGNQQGRARLNDVSALQQTMYPRCLILSTGEDTPEGHSVRGRMMITEISPGDIEPEKLTIAQKNRPLYLAAMDGFLQWIAKDLQQVQEAAHDVEEQIRNDSLGIGHSRTPTIFGQLVSGLWAASQFARTLGLGDLEYKLLDDGTDALEAIAKRQQAYLAAADPADQFIQVLRGILAANAGHIKAKNGGIPRNAIQLGWVTVGDDDWKPHGPRLGWEDAQMNTVYLDAQVVYDTIRRHSRGAITLTRATLYKRLREAGHLTEVDNTRQRNTVRVTLENAVRTVIALNLQTLLTKEFE